jgi:hypothetical protein
MKMSETNSITQAVKVWGSRDQKLIQSVFDMNALRPFTATLLVLWLGFLACVLGCSQPVLASTPWRTQISHSSDAVNNSGQLVDAAPCCHHHRTSDKNKQGPQTLSCCPLDATLIQKQDSVSSKSVHPYIVVLMPFVFNPSVRLSAVNQTNATAPCPAGRDVLLKAHVLRI